MRARHILRVLSFFIVVASLLYAGKLLKFNLGDTPDQRWTNLLGVMPLFIFGIVLWWYAGRKVDELDRPLFNAKSNQSADTRLGARGNFLAIVSIVSTFMGLCSVAFGSILAWRPEAFAPIFPRLADWALKAQPFLIIGALLIVLGLLAIGFARNGFWVAVSLLSGFTGLCGVALGAALAWHHDVMIHSFPFLKYAKLSSGPILVMSALLVMFATAALGLALRNTKSKAG